MTWLKCYSERVPDDPADGGSLGFRDPMLVRQKVDICSTNSWAEPQARSNVSTKMITEHHSRSNNELGRYTGERCKRAHGRSRRRLTDARTRLGRLRHVKPLTESAELEQ